MGRFEEVNAEIVACASCPRLREWCGTVAREKRKAFQADTYWGLPVPNFGDPDALGLIVGLAPAAHGANRTGRMFTGDRSGEWLYRALHRAGLANQPLATGKDDGLRLRRVMVTAVAHCAPPDNKPTKIEIGECRRHLTATLALREWRAYLCLGGIAWDELHRTLGERPTAFKHGAESQVGKATLIASYHPSQQNTFTGRLTETMLDDVVGRFASLVC